MKVLKRILIVIAVLVAIPLVLGLFVKKDYTVTREVTIARPQDQVFGYIKFLKNQQHYNKWVMADPKAKMEYKGTDGAPGFVYGWDSDKSGKGEQEIKGITEGQKLNSEIRFIKPFEGLALTEMSTEPAGAGQTKVKWTFNSTMHYPMNTMLLFMDMNDVLGKDLQESLGNLKNVLEKQPQAYTENIN